MVNVFKRRFAPRHEESYFYAKLHLPRAPLFGGWGWGKTKAKHELFFRTCEEGALSIKLIVEDYPFAGEGARNRD